MIFGMLYFDETYKLGETELIEAARKGFERRAGSAADLALISLSEEKSPEVKGLNVLRSHLVHPHNTIVGVHIEKIWHD